MSMVISYLWYQNFKKLTLSLPIIILHNCRLFFICSQFLACFEAQPKAHNILKTTARMFMQIVQARLLFISENKK